MPKFRVTTTEHRVYRVVYIVEAHDAAGAQAAIESDEGGTGDDDIGEVLGESLNLQETLQVTVGPVEEIAVKTVKLPPMGFIQPMAPSFEAQPEDEYTQEQVEEMLSGEERRYSNLNHRLGPGPFDASKRRIAFLEQSLTYF